MNGVKSGVEIHEGGCVWRASGATASGSASNIQIKHFKREAFVGNPLWKGVGMGQDMPGE